MDGASYLPDIRLFLIRHAESDSKVEPGIIGGRQNEIRLTQKGEKQAQELGESLAAAGIRFDRVFSSSAVRARETAAICLESMHKYSGCPMPKIVTTDDLLELSFGEWEGKPKDKAYTPEVCRKYDSDLWNTKPPNGESLADAASRMKKFVDSIFSRAEVNTEKDNNCAIFGHGLAIKAYLMEYLKANLKDFDKITVENTSVSELLFVEDESWELVQFNNCDHLFE